MSFVFVSNRPSLDLVGTLKWRRHEAVELLNQPGDVADWAVQARLIDTPCAVSKAGLVTAREVREAIYRIVTARREGVRWDRADLVALRRTAERPPVTVTMDDAGNLTRRGDLTSLLSTLTREAFELLGGDDADRIRECTGEICTRLFVDQSRGVPRRWCGMNECGNRVKAARYRQRHRASPE